MIVEENLLFNKSRNLYISKKEYSQRKLYKKPKYFREILEADCTNSKTTDRGSIAVFGFLL